MTIKILPSSRTFAAIFGYNEKNASELLDVKNFPSDNSADLQFHFEKIGAAGRVGDQVFHVMMSLPADERLDKDTWLDMVEQYMGRMGYGEQAYAVYEHNDTLHQHVHIVSSRVNQNTFKKIKDSNERIISNQIRQNLEKEYSLTPAQGHQIGEGIVWELNTILTDVMKQLPYTVEELEKQLNQQGVKLYRPQKGGYVFIRHTPGEKDKKGIKSSELPIFQDKSLNKRLAANKYALQREKTTLCRYIDAYAPYVDSVEKLAEKLAKKNIILSPHQNARGIYGISYTINGREYKGSDLGKQYTWAATDRRLHHSVVKWWVTALQARSTNKDRFIAQLAERGIFMHFDTVDNRIQCSFDHNGHHFESTEIGDSWGVIEKNISMNKIRKTINGLLPYMSDQEKFINKLKEKGIDTHFTSTRSGIDTATFTCNNHQIKAVELGGGYLWNNLYHMINENKIQQTVNRLSKKSIDHIQFAQNMLEQGITVTYQNTAGSKPEITYLCNGCLYKGSQIGDCKSCDYAAITLCLQQNKNKIQVKKSVTGPISRPGSKIIPKFGATISNLDNWKNKKKDEDEDEEDHKKRHSI